MRILFLSHYAEPLRAVRPVIEGAKAAGHEIFVTNLERVENERERVRGVVSELGIEPEFLEEIPWVDPPLYDLIKRIDDAGAHRLAREASLRQADGARAALLLDSVRPDVVVVMNEHMRLLRAVVGCAHRRGIGTVCAQWAVGNASVRHTLEMVNRARLGPDFADAQMDSPEGESSAPLDPAALPPDFTDGEVDRVADLVRRWDAEPGAIGRYWGTGAADRLAVFGEGPLETYVRLGTDRDRCRVVGSVVYEPLLERGRSLDRSAAAISARRGALGLPGEGPVVLWATNDQATYWKRAHDEDAMSAGWVSARDALLSAADDLTIALRVHPKEDPEQYRAVWEGCDRVVVADRGETADYLEAADFCLTRFSSVAFSATCLGVPAVTMNFPRVPGGTLYEDLGGTLHANSAGELATIALGLVTGEMLAESRSRGDRLIHRLVDLGDESAASRLLAVIEEAAAEAGRGASAYSAA